MICSPRLGTVLVRSILVGVLAIVASASAEETKLPKAVARIVDESEKEFDVLQEEHKQNLTKQLLEALADLDDLTVSYTKEVKLDEALAIRKAVQATADGGEATARIETLAGEASKLPDDAKKRIANLVAAAARLDEGLARRRRVLEKSRNEELQEQLEKFAVEGDLEQALAVRDLMQKLSADAGVAVAEDSPELVVPTIEIDPDDFHKAEPAYRKAIAELTGRYAKAVRASVDRAIEKLTAAQKQTARTGNLDGSLAIRDLLAELEQLSTAGQPMQLLSARVGQLAKAHQSKAPKASVEIVEQLVTALNRLNKQSDAIREKLNKAFSTSYRIHMAEVFQQGPLESIQQSVREYYQIIGDRERLELAYRPDSIPLPDDIVNVANSFQEDWNELLAKVDQQHQRRREDLLNVIEQFDVDGGEGEAVAKLAQSLNRGYAKSVTGFGLIPVEASLPKHLKKTMESAHLEVVSTLDAMRKAHADKEDAFVQKLEIAKQAAVNQGDFLTALAIALVEAKPREPLPTVLVKMFAVPHSVHTREVQLAEVASGRCRVIDVPAYSDGRWVSRSELLLEGDPEPSYDERSRMATQLQYMQSPPPRRVTAERPLARGMEVVIQDRTRRWVRATVLELTQDGAIVQDDTPFNRQPVEIERGMMRLP